MFPWRPRRVRAWPGVPRSCLSSATSTVARVDAQEVSKFDLVGSDWWDASSLKGTGPLHAMNAVRVKFIVDYATKAMKLSKSAGQPLRGLRLLDAGCGGGLLSEPLARLGAKVTGIDPAEGAIAAAQVHQQTDPKTRGIDYRRSTIEEISQAGEAFDVICSLEVVEHLPDPQAFLSECAGCIKPGGVLVVSTLNRTMKSYLLSILGAEYVLGLLPVGTHSWDKYLTPEEVTKMLQEAGMDSESIETSGMVLQNPLTLRWKLDAEDLDVNYIIAATKKQA